jgi:hypothetical protein
VTRLSASPIKYAGLASGALAAVLLPGARRACVDLAERLGPDGFERLLDLYVREGWSLEAAFDQASSPAPTSSPQPKPDAPARFSPQIARHARKHEVAYPTIRRRSRALESAGDRS